MIVNLNVMTKVQLNELGKQIWLGQIQQLPEDIHQNQPQVIQAIKDRIDENNCIELELWALMSIFGPYISPVETPFTSTTIELKKNINFVKT